MKNRRKMIAVMLYMVGMTALGQVANNQGGIRLSGRIQIEESGEEIAFVTITLQDDSARVIAKVASDVMGKFEVQAPKAGEYKLLFTAVGYMAAEKAFAVEAGESSKELGIIQMKEGVELQEVMVSAQRPLIKSDPDKLVYSVEADPDAKTNTLLEVIRKVPLLTVDAEENVTLNGQSNYKVLVNGKSSSLMSNNFKEVIKSMPANSIKDIEVITNPSSKYEAEGVGGIINIITVRRYENGYTGSAGINANSFGGYGFNGYISANINRLSFSTNIYTSTSRQPETESFSNRRNLNSETYHYSNSVSRRKNRGSGKEINFEAGFEIDTFNLISASVWGYLADSKSNSFSSNKVSDIHHNPVQHYESQYDSKFDYGYFSGNIDYQRSYMKKDKTLTASYKFDISPDNSRYDVIMNGVLNYATYKQKSDNQSSGNFHTFQLDYFDPLTENHQIEAGVKAIYRLNFSESDIKRLDSSASDWYDDIDRINDLDYDQYIMGIYAGYLLKLKKSSIKIGGRGEYTWNDGVFKTKVHTDFNNTFFNIIPYVNYTYSLKPTQTVKASYTQRLYRPSIGLLNPYVYDADPLSISYGNPNLKAEIAHSFNVTYSNFSPKFNVNLSLNASITDNSIMSYSFVTDEGVRHSTYDNIGSDEYYSGYIYASYRPSAKVNIYANTTATYIFMEANNTLNRSNKGLYYGGNLGGNFVFWKGGSISTTLYGRSPTIMLQGKSSAYYYMQIGVSQRLLKDKLNIGCYVTDPFWKKIYYKSDYDDPTYTMHSESYRLGQIARVSVTWRFGKLNAQVKKARRGISNDDQRSSDSGGGSGGE